MTKLVWDQPNQRRYESGVDHGVLYPSSGSGVVWNGLISVEESSVGGDTNSYYFDGIKYLDTVSPKDFQATLTAFSAPKEFAPSVGEHAIIPGFVLTRQPRVRFGLSYRTKISDGVGYKLHLVYNALATPSKRGYSSTNSTPSAENFSWQIDAVPPLSDSYRPMAHFALDSTKTNPGALSAVEDILYGTMTDAPRLPSVDELRDLVGLWSPVIITPDSTTGLSQLTPGVGDLSSSAIDGIFRSLPNTRLTKTATSGLFRLEL